jgi:SAM-dependent methyltransferase
MAAELAKVPTPAVLILGAGHQRNRVRGALGARMNLIAVDIDPAADVDLYCDAHELPFPERTFDAVIATAVLEHVLDPERVMLEIHRVLRPAGLLYSEVPFVQQVHEGRFDFTRYTLSGHRRLARRFIELRSGATAGPGTALIWAVEHLLLAITNRRWPRLTKSLARVSLFWLRNIDRRIANRPSGLDGASCTYFFGRRSEEIRSNRDIILKYSGAQRDPSLPGRDYL